MVLKFGQGDSVIGLHPVLFLFCILQESNATVGSHWVISPVAETKCENGRKKSNPSYISRPWCVGGSSPKNPQTTCLKHKLTFVYVSQRDSFYK